MHLACTSLPCRSSKAASPLCSAAALQASLLPSDPSLQPSQDALEEHVVEAKGGHVDDGASSCHHQHIAQQLGVVRMGHCCVLQRVGQLKQAVGDEDVACGSTSTQTGQYGLRDVPWMAEGVTVKSSQFGQGSRRGTMVGPCMSRERAAFHMQRQLRTQPRLLHCSGEQ